MGKVHARFKLWLSSRESEGVFGDGKWRLLKAIEAKGSLKEACEMLGISYRKAWGDLKKAERCLNTPLLDKQRGGQRGGRTILTVEGKRWLKAYTQFRRDVEKGVEKAYSRFMEEISR